METELLMVFVRFAMVTTTVATILVVGEIWDGLCRRDGGMHFDVVVEVTRQ